MKSFLAKSLIPLGTATITVPWKEYAAVAGAVKRPDSKLTPDPLRNAPCLLVCEMNKVVMNLCRLLIGRVSNTCVKLRLKSLELIQIANLIRLQ